MTPSASVQYLTRAMYHSPSHSVQLELENGYSKTIHRVDFFPSLLTDASWKEVSSLLSFAEKSEVSFEEGTYANRITSSSFAFLERLKKILEIATPARVLLISPVSQFLIRRKWRFLDAFSMEGAALHKHPKGLLHPMEHPGLISNHLEMELTDVLSENHSTVQSVSSELFFSNLLFCSVVELPKTSFERFEVFLENLFFEHGVLPLKPSSGIRTLSEGRTVPTRLFENTAEFDFSSSLVQMSRRSFWNLGFETLNCKCCVPESLGALNLLPHSLVKVRILSNGFFFESVFPFFAEVFHRNSPNKESRRTRQEEFGFSFPPLGPFQGGECVEIPLFDAERLESEGDALVTGVSNPQWFCLRSESFVSKALESLSERMNWMAQKIRVSESQALAEDRLRGFSALSSSQRYAFDRATLKLLSGFSTGFVHHLSNSSSRFFSFTLGRALDCARLLSMHLFSDLNSQKGLKCVSSVSGSSVFVQNSSGAVLASEFANVTRFPPPKVSEWHFVRRASV